jgi:SAM-dependent methyltransferase
VKALKSKDSNSDKIDIYLNFLCEKGIIQSETEKFHARFSEKSDYWKDRFNLFKSIYVRSIENLFIADFGCGFGGFTLFSTQKRGQLLFSDYQFKNVKITWLRLKELALSPFGRGVVSDVRFLPFRDETFDLVSCLEVLEHVGEETSENKNYDYRRDVKRAVDELIRVTKKSGHVFVLVPNKLFPLEIHSKTLFGNYFPAFVKKKLWGNIALSFTKNELAKYFEEVNILKVASWTRHVTVKPLKFDLTIHLPAFGLYLLAERT